MPATSAQRLEACLPYIFHGEGGYTNDRRDRGNWTSGKIGVGQLKGTKYGISAMSYPNEDIKNLTLARAAEIYRRDYWDQAGCHILTAGVDLPIFDVSVNSGPGRATAFRKQTESTKEPVARIKAISAKRRAFYQGLSTFKTYGKGWMSRVATIEAAAIKMAMAAVGYGPTKIKETLVAETKTSEKKVQAGSVGGAGTMTAGGAVGWDASTWTEIGLAVAVVGIAVAITYHFVNAHWQRGQAFQIAADEV